MEGTSIKLVISLKEARKILGKGYEITDEELMNLILRFESIAVSYIETVPKYD